MQDATRPFLPDNHPTPKQRLDAVALEVQGTSEVEWAQKDDLPTNNDDLWLEPRQQPTSVQEEETITEDPMAKGDTDEAGRARLAHLQHQGFPI